MEEVRQLQEDILDSILYSVKKQLGLAPDYGAFDSELILHINSVLGILNQMGVGPKKPLTIDGPDQTWGQFQLGDDRLDMVRTYVYLKVRTLFDPPSAATMFQAMNEQIDEYEFRLYVLGDEGGDDDDCDSEHRALSLRRPRHEVGSSQRRKTARIQRDW